MPESPTSPPARRGYRFRIFRYDHTTGAGPRFDTFSIDLPPRTSVLEALLRIQGEQDGSLAVRYSCRGAICGSCGVTINGQPDLACRVQLDTLGDGEIVVEPLAKLAVLKDLVVDMDPFWRAYRRVEPWLTAADAPPPDAERTMSQDQVDRVLAFANCAMCACCVSACPVAWRDPDFGPSAMAALYRHLADSRDDRGDAFLEQFNDGRGLWACDTVYRCCKVCPKKVRPTDGIAAMRRRLVVFAMRGWLGAPRRLLAGAKGGSQ